jgi:hypothetical protein
MTPYPTTCTADIMHGMHEGSRNCGVKLEGRQATTWHVEGDSASQSCSTSEIGRKQEVEEEWGRAHLRGPQQQLQRHHRFPLAWSGAQERACRRRVLDSWRTALMLLERAPSRPKFRRTETRLPRGTEPSTWTAPCSRAQDSCSANSNVRILTSMEVKIQIYDRSTM